MYRRPLGQSTSGPSSGLQGGAPAFVKIRMSEFPKITAGGSLLIAWQLTDKRVVLVGGGVVAASRLVHLLCADALVTLIAPANNLSKEVTHRINEYAARITWKDALYAGPQDLEGADMVLTAIDDNEASIRIWEDAKALKIPVNVADVPPNCDFYFGSMIRRGPLQVMVSTGGKGPKLAAMLREKLEKALPPETEQAIDKVGKLRAKLRARAPGVGGKLGQERMQWMTGVCEVWSLEDLADLDEPAMDRLLDAGWENRRVPDYQTVLGTGVWWKTLQRQWKEDGVRWFAGGLLSGVLLFALKRRYMSAS